MQRCRSSASREALARLLEQGLGIGIARGECDPGESDDPREREYESQCSEGQPPSKRMKQAGPSEDCKDKNQE